MVSQSSFTKALETTEKPKKRSCFFWGLLASCLSLLVLFTVLIVFLAVYSEKIAWSDSSSVSEEYLEGSGENKIAIIKIRGLIVNEPISSMDYTAAADVDKMIKKAKGDPSVKAVIVDIDSPGGTAVGAAKIYQALKNFSKPVVSFYSGDLAASGALYLSMGSDKIITEPETVTGSIGAIMESYDLSGLLDKYGIKVNTIKSGEYKDIGSMYRSMTDQERSLLQSLIEESHQQFTKAIAESRQLTETKVKEFADGRIFSGREAVKLGLVDQIGNFETAKKEALQLANISSAQIVEYEPPFSLQSLFSLLTSKFGKADPLSLIYQNQKNSALNLYYLMK